MAETSWDRGAPAERIDPVEHDYLSELLQQQRDVQVALDVYIGFLFRKYRLMVGQDQIKADGAIVRAPTAAAEPE